MKEFNVISGYFEDEIKKNAYMKEAFDYVWSMYLELSEEQLEEPDWLKELRPEWMKDPFA